MGTTFVQFLAILGAAGLGFVLGWTLYFANRGKSGNLSTSDLGAIAGVIAGGAVATLIGDVAGEQVTKAMIFGGYGIGLFAGFIAYFMFLRAATSDTDATAALRLPSSMRKLQQLQPLEADAGMGIALRMATSSAASNAILSQLRAAGSAVDRLTRKLAKAADDAEDTGDTAEADSIRAQLRKLDAIDREISNKIAIANLSGPEMTALLEVVKAETKKLKDEATRMQEITNDINAVADVLGALNTLADTLNDLT